MEKKNEYPIQNIYFFPVVENIYFFSDGESIYFCFGWVQNFSLVSDICSFSHVVPAVNALIFLLGPSATAQHRAVQLSDFDA